MNTNKKKIIGFSISFGVLLVALIVSLAIFFTLKPYLQDNKGYESDELKKYKEYYSLQLDKKANEYYILGVKNSKQKVHTLTFPETIDEIPVTKVICSEDSFSSFMYISEIVISKNIKYIGVHSGKDNIPYRDPFLLATGISSFVVDEENPYFTSLDGVLYSKDMKTLIKYPNAKDFGLGYVAFTIPDEVENISNHAFYLNDNLESITFGKNVNIVGFEAFKNCKKLDDVTFNDTLSELSKHAFNSCTNLSSITLPASLTVVGENCFSKCTKLREITILGSDTILKSAFSGITAVSIDLDNPTPQDSHVFFIVPEEETELLNKFTSVSFLNEIGITGLVGEEVYISIYLNGIKGVISDDLIEYKEK